MNINEIIPVVLKILTDIRVIGICIFVLLYVNFVFFVCRYKKNNKPKGSKKIRFKTPEPKKDSEQPEDESDNLGGEE